MGLGSHRRPPKKQLRLEGTYVKSDGPTYLPISCAFLGQRRHENERGMMGFWASTLVGTYNPFLLSYLTPSSSPFRSHESFLLSHFPDDGFRERRKRSPLFFTQTDSWRRRRNEVYFLRLSPQEEPIKNYPLLSPFTELSDRQSDASTKPPKQQAESRQHPPPVFRSFLLCANVKISARALFLPLCVSSSFLLCRRFGSALLSGATVFPPSIPVLCGRGGGGRGDPLRDCGCESGLTRMHKKSFPALTSLGFCI